MRYITKSKIKIFILLILGTIPHWGFIDTPHVWNRVGNGVLESDILYLDIHPTKKSIIFATTPQGLYRSVNGGGDFQFVLSPQGSDKTVNQIYIQPEGILTIYAATNSGVYQSQDEGRRWEQIFYASDAATRKCLSILADNTTIYVGTLNGLFYKRREASIWQRGQDILDKEAVFLMAKDEYYLYFATENKVFRLDQETNELETIFTRHTREEKALEEITTDKTETSVPKSFIKAIRVLPTLLSHIYLATTDGLFHSTDYGETWYLIPSGGIVWADVTSLIVLPDSGEHEFMIATHHGVFYLSGEKAVSLYKGMETTQINHLAFDNEGKVYAATNRGIFLMTDEKALSPSFEVLPDTLEHFVTEPSIREVQQFAIHYAEVHPNKIKQWRWAAKNKAWLPTLSAGLNRTASDYFHWDTGANPDLLLKGRDYLDWDVSLSWDLGELIWNDDQTSIDSRSKLMVELREDILDQITRLYFERRRLQVELLALETTPDEQLLLDKQLRLQELTALIDGFTGGEFSKAIEKRSQKPEARGQN